MVSELLSKYIWLVRTLISAGPDGLLLEDVCRLWERRWGEVYSRRTFSNHRAAVLEVFGLEIVCDRRTNRYSIPAGEDAMDGGSQWLIDTFTAGNLLSLSKSSLRGRVSVEEIPSGGKWLALLMEAMTGDSELELRYRKYTSDAPELLHVRPYALKEFEKRWYLVGYALERQALRVYGLDRIVAVRPDGQEFRMPEDFDVDVAFSQSFGIYLPEGREPSEIVLAATPREARYLRDLPLHHSQRELPPGEGARPCRFALTLIPNDAFVMELCRHKAGLEVVSPPSLRSRMRDELGEALKLYDNDN